MRQDRDVRRFPLPPVPEFPMKVEEKSMFFAEHAFLLSLPWRLFPEIINQETRKELFFKRISDLSSTQNAEQVFLAYGLSDGVCHSSRELSGKYNTSDHSIHTNTAVVIQSLWLLYGNYFSPDLYKFKKLLSSRYLGEGESSQELHRQKILERAKRNIDYYKDRELILKKEAETLKLLGGMYGKKTSDIFSRFYRLEEYKDSPNFERHGNFSFARGDTKERLMLEDALEVGHAAVEYLSGLPFSSVSWTGIRGQKVSGYRRKGAYFESILKRYQEQLEIARAIKDPNRIARLGALQVELLELTTSARLQGGEKKEGLEEFNQRHRTQYRLMDVKALERKVLGGFEGDRLTDLDRKEKIKKLLKDNEMIHRLGLVLGDILFDYHVGGKTIPEIAQDLACPVYTTGELKRFLERLVLNHFGNSAEHTSRGKVTKKMIDVFFRGDKLNSNFVRLLRRIGNSRDLPKLAHSLYPQWAGTQHAFELLRKLAVRVVDEKKSLKDEK